MSNFVKFVPLEISSINQTISVDAYAHVHEVLFFKSAKHELGHIEGRWWVEVSSRGECLNEDPYGHLNEVERLYYAFKGYLYLELENEAMIKSGIQIDADFFYDGKPSNKPVDSQGMDLPVQVDKLKSLYSATRESKYTFNYEMLKNIQLTVKLSLKRVVKCSQSLIEMEKYWEMTRSFLNIYDQDKFKNFTFIVGNQEFKIHKCVFGRENEVMKTMFLSGFEESVQNLAHITDITPEVFQVLVDFMYGNKIEFNQKIKSFAFSIYAAAHKFQITNLQDFCVEYISEHFTDPDHAVETYSFASLYELEQLKNKCWNVIMNRQNSKKATSNLQPVEGIESFFSEIQHHRDQLGKIKCQIMENIFQNTSHQ